MSGQRKRIPRPGDFIRITTNEWGKECKGKKFVVIDANYTNGINFSTHSFAWVELKDCEYAGRASDKQFFAALRRAQTGD